METHWDDLRGRELRYDDRTWELTGDVTVREQGTLLSVDAREIDGSKRRQATLHFDAATDDSLNPGNLADDFHHLERGATDTIVVKTAGRTYRYDLNRIAYD